MPSPRRCPGVKRQKPSWRSELASGLVDDGAARAAGARGDRGSRGSRRRRGSRPPGSRAGVRPRARPPRPRRASASLVWSPSGNQIRSNAASSTRGEHVALILARVGAASEEPASVALDDARVVAGRDPRRADAVGEREQLVEAERAVAADARVRRLALRVAGDERRHDGLAELLAQVERDVRDAARVARPARREHRARRAARPVGLARVRVDPEPERHADRVRPGPQQRDGAVDAAAHRDGRAVRIGRRGDHRPDRVRERVGRERLAGHGGSLEQRQPDEVALEPGRVGGDDPLPVDAQPDGGPVAVARRIAEELAHAASVPPLLSPGQSGERAAARRRPDLPCRSDMSFPAVGSPDRRCRATIPSASACRRARLIVRSRLRVERGKGRRA